MINVYQVVSDTNIGGAGRYLLNYVKYFDRNKFKVTVLVPEGSMLLAPLKEFLDISVKEIPYMADKSYDPRCVSAIREIFSSEKIDIVHTHASLSARVAARKEKVGKIISTRHCIEPVSKFPVSVLKAIVNNFLCDIYVAVSDAVFDNLRKSGIKKSKIRTVYNGVEKIEKISDEEKNNLKKEFDIKDETVFSVFARLEEVKGHKYFIEAAKKFLEDGGKGKFLIVGDGSLKEELKSLAKDTPDIIFTGYKEDTTPYLNITDVNVISSSSEAMSLAILEAMSAKKPTVATKVGGNPQLIENNENGILCDYKDSSAMALAFLKMADDKEFYEKCAEKAKEMYDEKFTAEIMVKNLEMLYEEVSNENN
ncbi:MAG: glycosyltransferase family 4 protein [Clostridia bacterium]|nr:glycosyltransferase family 4 protein [Clostridia bacterium]